MSDSLDSRSSGGNAASVKMTSSPPSTRKSGRLEKQTPLMPSFKRKSERVEHNIQSPLRRSERGKKDASCSSESLYFAEGSNSFEANKKKIQQDTNFNTPNVETPKVGTCSKNDKESCHTKRKRMDARSYRALFRTHKMNETTADDLQRMDSPCETNCAASQLSSSKLMKPMEEEGTCVRELIIDTEEECLKRFEDGAGRLVSSSRISVANISRDVGEAQLLNCTSRGSLTDESCEPSVPSGVVGETLADNSDPVGEAELLNCRSRGSLTEESCEPSVPSGVAGETLADNSDLVGASTGFSALEKSNQSFNSKILDPTCDVGCFNPSFSECSSPSTEERYHCFMGTCGKCSKVSRLKHDSPERELCSCDGASDPEANAMLRSAEKLRSCAKLVGAPGDPETCCHDKVCYVCCKDGNLLFCHGMGCGNCYHISCLDPALGDVPSIVWHCIWCVKKKIRSGVHSVSKGVEEIWDSREMMISDNKGTHLQKQFLVKYQGLAHVHNHWVPEKVLQSKVSDLVDKFLQNQQQGLRWNSDWTVPHRLLKKRLLKLPEQQKSSPSCSDSSTFCCQYEWLVKWCNLGYEHASWELEDADFLQSSLGEKLVSEYELRKEKMERVVDKSCEGSCIQMTDLPSGESTLTDSIMSNVNKLHEFWLKDQNAVVFDDQDRVVSSIFFVMSLADIGQPFLVIANSNATSHWETEFVRVAPSVDFVVYAGNEESRRSIRALEFYEGGRVIPQVLLASSEAALQDIHLLKDIRWGAILIDQLDTVLSTHREQMRMLTTNSRVILFVSQLKGRVTDYLSVLSLLDCHDSSKGGGVKCENNINKLKEQLSRYTAYGCIVEPSKFVEYWIPAQISNLQLEQYCATLLSNSVSLCSCSKNDLVGALREILSTTRKCCDHPYLVDSTLQSSIIKGLPLSEILDVGIKASGKLQLLDMMLSEIKARQLRVLILFQPIIGSAISIGDILDDFVRQRFGQNSYERVDTHVSKKQASLNRFNKKESGQFVFLLEKGACVPSIKLASVDTVIIFGSDWNPGNDLRALQKISIDSQFSQIKVFRLYSAFTIEEKALILAKQGMDHDNNLQSVSRSNTDALLSWGASTLFNRLEEFHSKKSRTMLADIPFEDWHADDVLREFQATLSSKPESINFENSLIPKVNQLKGVYSTNFPLLGEIKIKSVLGEEPHIFWKNLLEGRNPGWMYPCFTTRNRKRVQYLDGSCKKPEMENDELVKKRRKVVDNGVNPSPGDEPAAAHGTRHANQSLLLPDMGGSASCPSPASSLNSHDNVSLPERNQDQSGEKLISNEQKSIHSYLTAEMEKLYELLSLKEDMKHVLHAFMGYVVENHRVSKENVTIFQALQMSLCWVAASILKQKIDRTQSLMLAKEKLKFECSVEEAEFVYKKLRMLKKTFLQQPIIVKELQALTNSTSTEEHVLNDVLVAKTLEPVHSRSESQETAHEENLTHLEHAQEDGGLNHESEKLSMIREKQQKEIDDIHKVWEAKRSLLEKKNSVEAAVIRQIYSQNIVVRTEKLKTLDTEFSRKLEEHKKLMEASLEDLKVKHHASLTEERERETQLLAKCSATVDAVAVNNSHSKDDTLLDKCVDAVNAAEGCTTGMEIGSVPGAPTSERIRAIVTDRSSVLSDVEDNEVARPAKHPMSGWETHARQPSVSHVVDHHDVCNGIGSAKVTNAESYDKPFSGEANELLPADIPEVAHKELTSIDDPDTNPTGIQLSGSNDGEDREVGSGTRDLLENRWDEANDIDHSSDQASLLAHPDEEIDSLDHTISAPVQAPTDELSHCVMSTEAQGEVQGEDRSDQGLLSNFIESTESETVAQLTTHNITGGAATCFKATDNGLTSEPVGPESCGSANQTFSDACSSLQATEETHQVEEPPNHSQQHQPQVRENLGLSSARDIGNPNIPNNSHSLSPVINSEPTSGFCASICSVGNSSVIEDSSAQRINRSVQPASNQLGLSNLHPSLQADPLQIELEKLRKELEQTTKGHENLKSQLRSNCDKEIAEMVSEIRKKYEDKLHDAEATFQLKKKELESNVNKVFLNKLLADAVSTKCIDVRPTVRQAGVWRQQGFMQQLQLISLQPTFGHVVVGSSSPGGTPAAPQNTSLPAEPRSSALSVGVPSCRPPIISSISCPLTSARVGGDIRSTSPHVQAVMADVRAAAPHLQSARADVRAAAPHLQSFGVENRTTPPHLQPFRPPVSVTAPTLSSLRHSVSTQQFPVNQPTVTPPSQVLPVQPPELLSQQPLQTQSSETSPQIQHTSSQVLLPLSETAGLPISPSQRVAPASYHSKHPSALELLRDIDKQFNDALPNRLVSPVVLDSTVGQVGQSAFRGVEDASTSSVVPTDIVCLSDDE